MRQSPFQQLEYKVTDLIASIYGDSISELVGLPRWRGDSLIGYFRDRNVFYSYEIGNREAVFSEVNPRHDSYLQGFYLGDVTEYLPGDRLSALTYTYAQRGDARRKAQCKSGNVSCGNVCIPRGHKCRQKMTSQQKVSLRQTKKTIASNPELARIAGTAGVSAAVGAGAVALASRSGNKKLANQVAESVIQKQKEEQKRLQEEAAKKAEELQKERRKAGNRIRQVAAGTIEGAVEGLVTGGPVGSGIGAAIGSTRELARIGSEEMRLRSQNRSKATRELVDIASGAIESATPSLVETGINEYRNNPRGSRSIKKVASVAGKEAGVKALRSGTSKVTKRLRGE